MISRAYLTNYLVYMKNFSYFILLRDTPFCNWMTWKCERISLLSPYTFLVTHPVNILTRFFKGYQKLKRQKYLFRENIQNRISFSESMAPRVTCVVHKNKEVATLLVPPPSLSQQLALVSILTQGSNRGLLYCRQILYRLSHQRSKVKVCVTQSCPTPCDPMECSPPVSSVHGISQARKLEWVAFPISRGPSLTQGLDPGLLHCRQILYHLSHSGSPRASREYATIKRSWII